MSEAHRYAAIPTLGLTLAAEIAYLLNGDANIRDLAIVFIACLLAAAVVSVSSQLAFWSFRGLLGWQLVWKYAPLETAFQLKDIFVVTALVSFCVAAPQIMASVLINIAGRNDDAEIQIPSARTEGVIIVEEEVTVYPWQEQQMYAGYGFISAFSFFTTLLSFPIMAWLIRPHHGQPQGCAPAAFYVACGSIPLLIIPSGLILVPLIVVYTAAVAFPLATAFDMGVRLTSLRREAQQVSTEVI